MEIVDKNKFAKIAYNGRSDTCRVLEANGMLVFHNPVTDDFYVRVRSQEAFEQFVNIASMLDIGEQS